jgi:hypothetical protein
VVVVARLLPVAVPVVVVVVALVVPRPLQERLARLIPVVAVVAPVTWVALVLAAPVL